MPTDVQSNEMRLAARVVALEFALMEMSGYQCTCIDAFIGRGLVDPNCMAGEVGDDARKALGLPPTCKGRLAQTQRNVRSA